MLEDNLELIREKIALAAERSDFGEEVRLVPATKTVPADVINRLPGLGVFSVGENRVQELLSKYDDVKGIDWQFIGRLQTNKVKYIIDKVSLIHSVDRIELAREIDRCAGKRGKVQNILIEINMGSEESKGGITPEETEEFAGRLSEFPNINLQGIMSILPNIDDSAKLRDYYLRLRGIYDSLKRSAYGRDVRYLSAGMSGDYEIAVECGANLVRIGSALFGKRS